MEKRAKPVNFDIQGPSSIDQALSLYLQAKLLATPSTEYLKSKGLNRRRFDKSIRDIRRKTRRGSDKFDLASIAPDPKRNALIGGVTGALAGGLLGRTAHTGEHSLDDVVLNALLGGGAGAAGAFALAEDKRGRLLQTAKVLKDYGLLTPEKFHKAAPLLHSEL